MRICGGCGKTGYLYPSKCAKCSDLPANVYQLRAGMTFTTDNGTVIQGGQGPKVGMVLVKGLDVFLNGSFGDIRVKGGNVTYIGIPR